ncbi:MAG: hypothetical protein M3O70_21955 [Actinomycetota bacterium]|nr:hypothetical protein [Actinomycetota bacterium]
MAEQATYWRVWDDGAGYVELANQSNWKILEDAWAAAREAGLVNACDLKGH